MSYVVHDYASKRLLKADVDALRATLAGVPSDIPVATLRRRLTIAPTAVSGGDPRNGEAFLEGPHYPKPHRWYAKVQVTDGVVTKVLS